MDNVQAARENYMAGVTLLISPISHRRQYKMFHFIHFNGWGPYTNCYETAVRSRDTLKSA